MTLSSWMVLLSVLAVCYCSRPPYIGCLSSDECGQHSCCVIGMGRYSIPICRPRLELGEDCRPEGEPVNTTLHYPDDATVKLEGVYYLYCPCLNGLDCGNGAVCVDQVLSNHVYDYSEENNFEY